ncbi:MAG: hypothetical protein U0U66_13705 [Cytophagaceae bacterium]
MKKFFNCCLIGFPLLFQSCFLKTEYHPSENTPKDSIFHNFFITLDENQGSVNMNYERKKKGDNTFYYDLSPKDCVLILCGDKVLLKNKKFDSAPMSQLTKDSLTFVYYYQGEITYVKSVLIPRLSLFMYSENESLIGLNSFYYYQPELDQEESLVIDVNAIKTIHKKFDKYSFTKKEDVIKYNLPGTLDGTKSKNNLIFVWENGLAIDKSYLKNNNASNNNQGPELYITKERVVQLSHPIDVYIKLSTKSGGFLNNFVTERDTANEISRMMHKKY